jgi:hypothetical protein
MGKPDRTAWQGSTPPSLIQQRMQIDRRRTGGLVPIWVGTAWMALGVARLLAVGVDAFGILQAIGGAFCVGLGVLATKRHKRELAAFEAEHGRDAGTQKPIAPSKR